MFFLLIFLLITGSCLAGLFGRYLDSKGSSMITTSCLFVSFFLALFAFYEVGLMNCFVYVKLSTWINSDVLHIDWSFMFDNLTVILCVVVTFVYSLVQFYYSKNMRHHIPRQSFQIPFSLVWNFDFFIENIYPFIIFFGFLYLIIPTNFSSPKFLFFYNLQLKMLDNPLIVNEFYYLSENDPRVQYLSVLIKSIKFLKTVDNQAVPYSYFNDDWCILLAKYCVHFDMYNKAVDFFV